MVGAWPEIATNGRAVHVGVGHAGHQVGGAGSQRGQADARPAGQAAVDVGHEGGPLLVSRRHKTNGTVQEHFEEVDVFLAGNAENVLHALIFQTADEQFGSFHEQLPRVVDALEA